MDAISGPMKKSQQQLSSGLTQNCRELFDSGMMTLKHHWYKYVILEGNYTEKGEVDFQGKSGRLVTC